MANPQNPLSAPIAIAGTASGTPVAAVGGMPIVIWKLFLTADAATTITLKDTNSKSYSGPFDLQVHGSLNLPFDGLECMRTDVGTGFVITQSGTANINGIVLYTRG